MRRRWIATGLACACLLATAPVFAATPHDLPRRSTLTITGMKEQQGLGYALTAAGDVNGDDIPDLLARTDVVWGESPLAYVVFGGSSDPIDIASLGARGFAITSSDLTDLDGTRSYEVTGVAGAGDLNGDGLDDIILGNPSSDSRGRVDAGAAFVVFGKANSDPVDISQLATQGIRIDGADEKDEAGVAVASTDVDGDGTNDVVVGAPFAGDGTTNTGKVYVVFGAGLIADVDLGAPFHGYTIEGPLARQAFGSSVADAGDMNGDGLRELIIGAPSHSSNVRSAAYVVEGRSSSEEIDLGADGWPGWEIRSRGAGSFGDLGRSVAGGADFNGDGVPDVLVGAPYWQGRRGDTGLAVVVFGAADPSNVVVQELGGSGLKIFGPSDLAETGRTVAFLPDQDGDGMAEALIGSPRVSDVGFYETGRIDVIQGTTAAARIDLAVSDDVSSHVGAEGDRAGGALAFVGDFASDGDQLIAIGAPQASSDETFRHGLVYLLTTSVPANDLPPRATLYSYRARQSGQQGSYCWDGVCVDRVPSFPESEIAAIKDDAIIRLGIDERPEETALTYYRDLDEFGRPAGAGRALAHVVRRQRGTGVGGFEVTFRNPRRRGNAYLVLSARWAGEDKGDVTWFFHLDLDGRTYTHISSVPRAHLFTGGIRQRGETDSYSWSKLYVDGFGSTLFADAFRFGFPDPKPADHGDPAYIRIHERHRPNNLVIRTYRRAESTGDDRFASEYPKGPRTLIDFRWRAVRFEGKVVAHDAFFRLPRSGKHAYFVVRARYRFHGTAPWQFHLRFI